MVVFKNEEKEAAFPHARVFESKDYEYLPVKTFIEQAVADEVKNENFQRLNSLPKLSSRPKLPQHLQFITHRKKNKQMITPRKRSRHRRNKNH